MAVDQDRQRALAMAKARLRLKQPEEPPAELPIFQWARETPFLKGYLDPAAGLAQLSQKALPERMRAPGFDEFIKREEKAYQEQRAREGETGFDWQRMMGAIISPPSVATMGGPLTAIPKTLVGKSLMGAGTGAVYSQMAPVTEGDYAKEKVKQAIWGATIGGAIPVGIQLTKSGAKYLNEFIKPLTEKGVAKDVKKIIQNLSSDPREKIILTKEKLIDLISGRKGTAGQAFAKTAGDIPEDIGSQFIALEKGLSRDPITGQPLRSIYKSQQKEREAIIDAIAGTKQQLKQATKTRSEITDPLYRAVEKSTAKVDIKPIANKIDDILSKNRNETAITTPLGQIKKKLTSDKPGDLASLSREIKSMLGKKTQSGQPEFNEKALTQIKKLLDSQIGKAEPLYNTAQGAYQITSTPINQMKVGTELKDALITAMEKESPSTFTTAMRKAPRTVKRATGYGRAKDLSEVFTPEQIKSINRISEELITQGRGKAMASSVESVMKEVSDEAVQLIPQMLSRPAMIVNAGLRLLGKDRTPLYKKLLTEIMEDPKKLAEALTLPATNQRYQIAKDIIIEAGKSGGIQTTGREIQ